jgi:hypothetical protein
MRIPSSVRRYPAKRDRSFARTTISDLDPGVPERTVTAAGENGSG